MGYGFKYNFSYGKIVSVRIWNQILVSSDNFMLVSSDNKILIGRA